MAISTPVYVTREEVKSALDIKETARSNGAVDRAIMLDTIAAIETGHRNVNNGSSKGVYQMMPVVRRVAGGHDRAAAMRWLDRVIADMMHAGIEVSPFNVALVWRRGITEVRQGRVHERYYEYAVRADRLYHAYLSERTRFSSISLDSPAH